MTTFTKISRNISQMTIRNILLSLTLLIMAVLFFLIIRTEEPEIPQQEAVIKLDIKDKVNICLPSDER